jgi:diguanylate cyclase (GGDEF)-like protein
VTVILRWSPMAALLLGSAAVDTLAAAWVQRRRSAVGGRALVILLAAAAVWCLAYGLELITVGRTGREFWGSLEFAGTVALPPAWLVFVLTYTGHRDRVSRPLIAALAVEPVLLLAVLAVPATHDLVRSFAPGLPAPVPSVRLGPVFWVHFAWTTAVSLAATVVLVVRLLRLSAAYRRQSITLAVAAAVPLLGNIASSFGIGPARTYDPTPLAASAGGLVLVWGAFQYRLLELLPAARTLAFERLGDPILVVDALGRVVDRNPSACRLLGPGAEIGSTLQDLLQRQAAVLDATSSGPELRMGEGPHAREYELVASGVNDHRGAHAGHLVHLRDITERKHAERHLRFLAENDPLTGLPNRRVLGDRLGQAIARCQRSQGLCALLLFDVDQFKAINDSLGHPMGDLVLAEVARRLQAGRRDGDTVARLSGDEFAVLLPEVADPGDAALAATRALTAIAEPMHLDGRTLRVTASAGVAVWPDDGWDARQLFGRVDAAMYRAKQHGRNQARASHETRCPEARPGPMDDDPAGTAAAVPVPPGLAERWELGLDLRGAEPRGELCLTFEPLVSLRDGTITGMQSQVRWHHPRHGTLRPQTFLPLAEDLGLAESIDRWLLAQACAQACRWTRGGRRVPVSLRIPPRRLRPGGGLCADVAAVLGLTTLPPDLLVLQVREQDVVADPGAVAAELQALHALGVGLALDHFGAEHTSLTQLRRLPIGTLGLDRELVAAARAGGGGVRVLGAATTLAHLLGMTVVADAVDRPESLALLRHVGCDAGQGPLFSPPLDPRSADRLVAAAVLRPAPGSDPGSGAAAPAGAEPLDLAAVTVTSATSAP